MLSKWFFGNAQHSYNLYETKYGCHHIAYCHEVPGLAKEDNGESKGNVTQYVPRYILGEATKLPSCRVRNNILVTKC